MMTFLDSLKNLVTGKIQKQVQNDVLVSINKF